MQSESERASIGGVVPIVPTPFDEDEQIDTAALQRLIDFAVSCGVGAVCLPAYGSEFYKLTDQERLAVVRIAVDQAAGRLVVIGQCNHASSRVALSMAQANVAAGAGLISVAIPRTFSLSSEDLLRYLEPILNGVDVPCLVQDFNPGGPTVTVDFVIQLLSRCPNLRYLKLEESLSAQKIASIRQATQDRVKILEGWGGLYLMELVSAGICGVMPGLGMADVLNRVFFLRRNGESERAFDLYGRILPHIVFSLQNLELYLYMEKRLLQRRGVLPNAHCRSASLTPDSVTRRYVEELSDRVLQAVEQAKLGH
jgi:4-hydroxy-tetrahydrodipicolinate synthase